MSCQASPPGSSSLSDAVTCSWSARPTRSISPNTPVLGAPIASPISRSASSTVSPRASASPIAVAIQYTPSRLATKPGVSLQRTTALPRRTSAKASTASIASPRVVGPRHGLEQLHVARRVEEMGDQEVGRKARRRALGELGQRDGRGVGRDDRAGLAHRVEPGVERRAWRRVRSMMASTIQSASATWPRSLSSEPGVISRPARRSTSGAGLRLARAAAPRARGVAEVEQHHGHAGVGDVRGDPGSPSCRRRSRRPCGSRSHGLQHGGDALAAADALGRERVAAALAVEQRGGLAGDAGAGGAERVAERDRAAVEVDA